MKHIKLFEQYINEASKDEFMAKMVKNPVTGREVKVASILSDPKNPLYKRLKAKADELDGGGSDEAVEKLKKQLEDEKEELGILQTQLSAAGQGDEDDDGGMGVDIEDIEDDVADVKKTIADLELKIKEAKK
tara:strand:- start:78 stop:473 length:396 start_codon:yes stop_codon:yes gene_type:complete